MKLVDNEPVVLDQWSARAMRPVIIFYVAVMFAVFMTVAYFVLNSPTGVKALALAAVGAIVPLVPGVLGKVEYRATASGIEKRRLDKKSPGDFEEVLRWEDLSHVVPTRDGFKYCKQMNEPSRLRRFWKIYFSDAFSGEVHVETKDRDRVLELVRERGFATSKPVTG
jgi:hypothetical protein